MVQVNSIQAMGMPLQGSLQTQPLLQAQSQAL